MMELSDWLDIFKLSPLIGLFYRQTVRMMENHVMLLAKTLSIIRIIQIKFRSSYSEGFSNFLDPGE